MAPDVASNMAPKLAHVTAAILKSMLRSHADPMVEWFSYFLSGAMLEAIESHWQSF